MQNSFVTDAINLKSYNLSESDRIMVMYSKEKGLIRGVAKGVKKTKSKLGARMDLLVANTLMLHKGRNLNTICQAEVVNSFYKTRQNMDKICYSMYVTEVVHNFGIEDDPCSEIVYNLLYKTENDDRSRIFNRTRQLPMLSQRNQRRNNVPYSRNGRSCLLSLCNSYSLQQKTNALQIERFLQTNGNQ